MVEKPGGFAGQAIFVVPGGVPATSGAEAAAT